MKYIIEKDNEGVRLDRYLRKKLKDTPLTEIFKALRIGKIKVNNKKKKENYRLVEGDKIFIGIGSLEEMEEKKDFIKLSQEDREFLSKNIVFENDDLIIFNKDKDIVMHKGSGFEYGISEMFKSYYETDDFNFINRIDKKTSGLVIGAKNKISTRILAVAIKEYETRLQETKEDMAKRIISTAIGKAASEYVVDSTVSVVNLPNDEMKGRIIGREGRNIRTIESLTGVDVIIDDTPEAVVLSSYDGVKREIAKRAIDKLISDGRIHPGKIEELVNKARKEIEKDIIDAGEQALLEVGIQGLHPEIVKTLGKLKYRTSYGQNVLVHSIEVAKLCGTLAAELGCNVKLAKRGGLLHDIGKVLDHETESSHAIIGGEFLRKFGEKEDVINAVMGHHNEVEKKTVEAVLVQAADAVSASRPGSRRETLSAYLKRLASLEEIANSFKGVESSYAIQAGREMRIVVNPETISDDEAIIMARDMAKKIEDTMQYPGQIKVTILRETRATEYAR